MSLLLELLTRCASEKAKTVEVGWAVGVGYIVRVGDGELCNARGTDASLEEAIHKCALGYVGNFTDTEAQLHTLLREMKS